MSVDADIPTSLDLFGKSVTDLQTGIIVGNDSISGTLNNITGYTGFSGNVSEQSGHYLVLHCDVPDLNDEIITVEVVGGTHGPVTLDSDHVAVLRIANTTQSVKFTASKNGNKTYSKTYSLTNLTLS